ncbi:MAG: hypothetical protein AAFP86_03870 [Planctomycetota bacterium]
MDDSSVVIRGGVPRRAESERGLEIEHMGGFDPAFPACSPGRVFERSDPREPDGPAGDRTIRPQREDLERAQRGRSLDGLRSEDVWGLVVARFAFSRGGGRARLDF